MIDAADQVAPLGYNGCKTLATRQKINSGTSSEGGRMQIFGKRSQIVALGQALALWVAVGLGGVRCYAQMEFEGEPIRYYERPLNDPIAKLQAKVDAGEVKLAYDADRGYLPAVLDALKVPSSSQMLVFSKTSFQLQRISPQRPRAVYFSDDMYVGWVQSGDVVEISAVDPEQGAVFYTLDQEESEHPRFVRDKGQCLACHASARTQGVPGHLVRSVFASPSGQPHFGSGTFTTDHRSPFEERWGGWYVTGKHGAMRHMGNVLCKDRDAPEKFDREAGANQVALEDRIRTAPYLESTSDIVALMVLEHQTQMHNWITLANFTARRAAYQDHIINEALEREENYESDSTKRQIASAGDKLLQYLLFSKEFALTSPVEGSSRFTEEFAALGPRDSQGRSLRDFDLQRRIFRYPCSYLIYSPSFDAMPPTMKGYVLTRLKGILEGTDKDPAFDHLTSDDRANILAILQETKPTLFQ